MNLDGRHLLITGGAGGLGRTIVHRAAAAGAAVHVLDIAQEAGTALERHVNDDPAVRGSVTFVPCDLADTDRLEETVASLAEQTGGIGILVNNAAIYPSKPIEAFSMEEFRAVQSVNLDAAVACTRTLTPGMKRAGWGRIVNISSITFYGGWANLMPYVVSKGGLVGLTRALARELGQHAITCNAIAPGAFPTDAEKIHPDPEGYARFVLDHQSIKRRGDPVDIANAVLFLASDESSFITGQLLNVDGGWVMQ